MIEVRKEQRWSTRGREDQWGRREVASRIWDLIVCIGLPQAAGGCRFDPIIPGSVISHYRAADG